MWKKYQSEVTDPALEYDDNRNTMSIMVPMFTTNGYFILNRAVIMKIFAFFTTYVIVALQFGGTIILLD